MDRPELDHHVGFPGKTDLFAQEPFDRRVGAARRVGDEHFERTRSLWGEVRRHQTVDLRLELADFITDSDQSLASCRTGEQARHRRQQRVRTGVALLREQPLDLLLETLPDDRHRRGRAAVDRRGPGRPPAFATEQRRDHVRLGRGVAAVVAADEPLEHRPVEGLHVDRGQQIGHTDPVAVQLGTALGEHPRLVLGMIVECGRDRAELLADPFESAAPAGRLTGPRRAPRRLCPPGEPGVLGRQRLLHVGVAPAHFAQAQPAVADVGRLRRVEGDSGWGERFPSVVVQPPGHPAPLLVVVKPVVAEQDPAGPEQIEPAEQEVNGLCRVECGDHVGYVGPQPILERGDAVLHRAGPAVERPGDLQRPVRGRNLGERQRSAEQQRLEVGRRHELPDRRLVVLAAAGCDLAEHVNRARQQPGGDDVGQIVHGHVHRRHQTGRHPP